MRRRIGLLWTALILVFAAAAFSACERCEHQLVYHPAAEATCTQDGNVEYWSCSLCARNFADEEGNEPLAQVILPGGHTYGEWENVREASCVQDGLFVHNCTRCGHREERVSLASGEHVFGEWRQERAPDCSEAGLQARTCSVCGAREENPLPSLGHSFGEWSYRTEPTCTEQGEKVRTCARCGKEETHEVFRLGHVYDEEWKLTLPPTCTQAGEETRACARCGKEESRPVAELGHLFEEEWTIVTPPTCVQEGQEKRSCVRCDGQETRAIAATGIHIWGAQADSECAQCSAHLGYTYGLKFSCHNGECTVIGYDGAGTEVLIPAAYDDQPVTRIGENAFYENKNITKVTFAQTSQLATIGGNAFCSAAGLTEFVFPASLTWMGSNAFCGTGLREVSLAQTDIAYLFDRTFAECGALERVTLPETLLQIGTEAFARCNGLRSVTIPAAVRRIGTQAFYNSGLQQVQFANGARLSFIGSGAFAGSGLTQIVLPADLSRIEAGAFAGCPLESAVFLNTRNWTGGKAFDPALPEEIERGALPVQTVADPALAAQALTGTYANDVLIRDDVHSFTEWKMLKPPACTEEGRVSRVCVNCGLREEVSLPAGHLFSDWTVVREATCTQAGLCVRTCALCDERLEKEIAPGHKWDDGAQSVCTVCGEELGYTYGLEIHAGTTFCTVTGYTGSAKDVCIPAQYEGLPVTRIGEGAFTDSALSTISLPDSLTSIGAFAFYRSSLTCVTIPASVHEFGRSVFSGCRDLTSAVFLEGSSVKVLNATFDGCSSLKEVRLPDGAERLTGRTFFNCRSLVNVSLPAAVREIGENVFTYCVSLTAVKFEGAEDWRAVREGSIGGIADEAIFSAQELAVPERAAQYLVNEYCSYLWTREE